MKKAIAIIILGLLWCNVGFAEMKFIEEKKIKDGTFTQFIQTVCIDGYKFVIVNKRGKNQSTSIVQFYEVESFGGKSLPAKC